MFNGVRVLELCLWTGELSQQFTVKKLGIRGQEITREDLESPSCVLV